MYKPPITKNDIKTTFNWCSTGLEFLTWGHASIIIAWGVATLIIGFANGLWHGTPIAYEIFLIKLMASAINFGLRVEGNDFVSSLKSKSTIINVVIFFLVIGIAINITHLVFSCIEISGCSSQLCVQDYWFLFIFLFILGALLFVEIVLIVYFWLFKSYIQKSLLILSPSSVEKYTNKKNP